MDPFGILGNLQFLLWPFVVLVLLFVVVGVFVLFFGKRERDFSVFQKRKYLFDTRSEFELFNILNELYADRFYIFPQVHYSHIIEVSKKIPYRERFRYWNSINRKSADFVLCDKQQVIPRLVIELDGSSHELEKRKERDEFIDHLMSVTGLSICHLKTQSVSKEFVREEVDRILRARPETVA